MKNHLQRKKHVHVWLLITNFVKVQGGGANQGQGGRTKDKGSPMSPHPPPPKYSPANKKYNYNIVDPLKKGHVGTNHFVLCREFVHSSEVQNVLTI